MSDSCCMATDHMLPDTRSLCAQISKIDLHQSVDGSNQTAINIYRWIHTNSLELMG